MACLFSLHKIVFDNIYGVECYFKSFNYLLNLIRWNGSIAGRLDFKVGSFNNYLFYFYIFIF